MYDLVSVIITSYKRKYELEQAIVSVIKQTYSNIEIIVVDDNTEEQYSKDVVGLCDKYASDRCIKYFKNHKNLGGALSRNVGISHAKGKYIAFLDDDDLYLPEKIEKQVKCFKTTEYDKLGVVYCFTKAIDKNGEVIKIYENRVRGYFLRETMINSLCATSQIMCLADALIEVGGFRDVPSKQDATLLLDIALAGYQIDYVPEVLACYFELDIDRISGRGIKNLKGEILLREKIRSNYLKFPIQDRNEMEINISLRIYYLQLDNYLFIEAMKTLNEVRKIMGVLCFRLYLKLPYECYKRLIKRK